MTIPVSPVQIHPQFAETPQGSPGIALLLKTLVQRQEIEQARQKNLREMQQFEMQKRLMGTEIAGNELVNEKRKRELKTEADDVLAKEEAHRLFAGNLTSMNDMASWGRLVAGVKDEAVARHLMSYVKDYYTTEGAQPASQLVASPDAASSSGFSYKGIDPRNPGAGAVSTGVAAANPSAPVQRIPVVTEREKASAAVGAAQANSTVNRLENADPQIGARVARKVATQRSVVGALAKRLIGVPPDDIAAAQEATIEGNLSPDELAYYQAQKQWLGSVLPGLSGKQVTSREYMMQAPPYFSMGASTPQVVQNRRKARATRTRGFIAEAGDAMQERLGEIPDLGEYGLGGPPPVAGVTVSPAGRYHPKFNQP